MLAALGISNGVLVVYVLRYYVVGPVRHVVRRIVVFRSIHPEFASIALFWGGGIGESMMLE
eukprot:1660889-Pleurochrysis_carterae.AAC.1